LNETQTEQEKTLQQVQTSVQVALPVGPTDPPDSVVPEVSMASRDAVLSISQAPIGEPKFRSFDFRSKTLPSSADFYSLFLRNGSKPTTGT
jgi:hypothetical protein